MHVFEHANILVKGDGGVADLGRYWGEKPRLRYIHTIHPCISTYAR